jgi:hypothetical protein
MAFHTGPLYHLKGQPENVENHNKLLDNPREETRSILNDPEPSIRVRPEMFREIHIFSALFWAFEWNEKYFLRTNKRLETDCGGQSSHFFI